MASRPPRNRRSGTRPGTGPEGPGTGPRKMASGWQIGGLGGGRERGVRAAAQPASPASAWRWRVPAVRLPPPHTHIWKMFSSTGLLEGFWEVTPGGGWDRGLTAPTQPSPPRGTCPFPSTPWPPGLQFTSPSPGPSVLYTAPQEDGSTGHTAASCASAGRAWRKLSGLSNIQG